MDEQKSSPQSLSNKFKQIDWNKIKVICLLFLSFATLLLIFKSTKDILVPFVIALFLYYAMNPLVSWYQKHMRIPRVFSMFLTIFSALIVAGGMIFLVGFSFSNILDSIDQYQNKIIDFTMKTVTALNVHTAPLGFTINPDSVTAYYKNLPVMEWARSFSAKVFDFFGQTVLVVLFFIFLETGAKLKGMRRDRPEGMARKINQSISKYVATKFFISLLTGILIATTLLILRIDFALMFGLLAFLLNFIPSIGSIIATLLPIPIALMEFGPTVPTLLTLLIPTTIQFTIGNLIEPKIMGQSLGLHPVVILLSLLLWGFIWGIPGMFMAAPMTAILKIVLSRYELTFPFAKLLEGEIYRSE